MEILDGSLSSLEDVEILAHHLLKPTTYSERSESTGGYLRPLPGRYWLGNSQPG